MGLSGSALLLKIYCGETEKWKGKSLYQQLVYKLKEAGIAGVTVSRGLMGYGEDKVVHSAKIIELSADLPMVVEAVDCEENIRKVLPEIKEMVPKGLVIVIPIEVIRYGKNK